jgi:hypothetical protein
MNEPRSLGDPVVLAGGAAAVGGALALLDPFFRGLTEAATALAVVAWVPTLRPYLDHGPAPPPTGRLVGAVASLSAGGFLFFALPSPFEGIGALGLGASALGLLAWTRPGHPAPEAP